MVIGVHLTMKAVMGIKRYELSDPGRTALDSRLFVYAVLWVLRAGGGFGTVGDDFCSHFNGLGAFRSCRCGLCCLYDFANICDGFGAVGQPRGSCCNQADQAVGQYFTVA